MPEYPRRHERYSKKVDIYQKTTDLYTDRDNVNHLTVVSDIKKDRVEAAYYIETSSGKVSLKWYGSTLSSFEIPAYVKAGKRKFSVTSIGSNAFQECKLASVIIGKNVKTIKKNAVKGQKKLKEIHITAAKLKTVGKDAFKDIAKSAVFYITGSASDFERVKSLITASGIGNKVSFEMT